MRLRLNYLLIWLPLVVTAVSASLAHGATNLLAYYDGTVSGTTLVDQSGNGRNAAFDANGSGGTSTVLATAPANANSGSYVSLEPPTGSGNTGRYSVTPAGGFSYDFNNTSWSVAMFYNRQSTTSHDMMFHIGAGDAFGGENELYAYGAENSTNLGLQRYATTADVNITSVGKANASAWHHLAVTFQASGLNDGMGTLTLYVDGAVVGTDNSFTLGTNNTFYFGGQGSGTALRNFHGFLDDMAIYGSVLTAGEIASLANGTQNPLSIVPEPSKALLVMLGVIGLLVTRRSRLLK